MQETDELERRPDRDVLPDAISVAVGESLYVQNHRLDVRIESPAGHSPRLRISRYYWGCEPPVAVDFAKDLQWGEKEAILKKQYFAEQGVRYIVIKNQLDGEGAEAALRSFVTGEDEAQQVKDAARPLVGPRRS